jgi:hypothetical protein
VVLTTTGGRVLDTGPCRWRFGQSQNGCQRLTWIDQATSGATLSWDSDPGVHCVLIYDSGTLSEAATYTVNVTHP